MSFGLRKGSSVLGRVSILVLLLLAAALAVAQSAPSGVWAISSSATSVQVAWNPVPGATSYALYAGSASNTIPPTPVATTTGLSLNHTGLNSGSMYHYKVAAFYGNSRSPLSNEVTCVPGTQRMAGPLVAAYADAGRVILHFSQVPNATYYRIFRSAGSAYTMVGATTGDAYVDNGLVDGIQYRYIVRGASAYTDHLNSADVYAVPGDAPLPAPTATWSVANATSNSVYWQPVTGATGYVIFRGETTDGEGWAPYATTTGTSFADTGLVGGKTFFYKVAAYDSSNTSLKSTVASAKVGSTRLAAPYLAAAAGAGKVTLNWTAVPTATQFLVFRKSASGEWEMYARATNRTFVDTGVTDGTTYAYCVYALNANGLGNASSTITAKPGALAPGAPQGIYVVAGNAQNSIYWQPVAGATSYNLYRGSVAGKEKLFKAAVQIGATDTGLTNGTRYFYRVKAVAKGTEGKVSASASGTPGSVRLSATQLAAYPVSGKIQLYWDLVPGAEGYNVFRTDSGGTYRMIKPKVQPASGAGYGSFTDVNVVPAVPYSYVVNAVDQDGQGLNSNVVVATAGNPPLGAPAFTYAIAQSTYANVYCTPVQGATSYNVYRASTPDGFGPMPYKVGAGSGFTDNAVSPGTTYYYKFVAVDEDGQSAPSPVCAVTPGSTALSAPIVTSYTASDAVSLYWSATDGATSYNIFRSVGGGAYVQYKQDVTGVSYVDDEVTTGQRYSYQIYPVSTRGMGNRSNTVAARPGSTMLAAPTGLYVYKNGTGGAYLNWDPVVGASSYNVYRSTTPDGQGLVPVAVGQNTAFGDSGLASTLYYYRITAVNANGQSLKSIEVSVNPGVARLARVNLYTPTTVSGKITLGWSKHTGATEGYHVFRLMSGGVWQMIAANVTAEGCVDQDVIPGVEYSYQVAPVSVNGTGILSNIQKKVAQ
jgi:fibronectin type 3 domain-containing protein